MIYHSLDTLDERRLRGGYCSVSTGQLYFKMSDYIVRHVKNANFMEDEEDEHH